MEAVGLEEEGINVYISVFQNDVLRHFGKNPENIRIYFTENAKFCGIYSGKLCLKCEEQECVCEKKIFVFMNRFDLPAAKKILLGKNYKKVKSILLDDLHRKIGFVKFSDGLAFEEVGSKKRLYLFVNDEGYLEQKIIL